MPGPVTRGGAVTPPTPSYKETAKEVKSDIRPNPNAMTPTAFQGTIQKKPKQTETLLETRYVGEGTLKLNEMKNTRDRTSFTVKNHGMPAALPDAELTSEELGERCIVGQDLDGLQPK